MEVKYGESMRELLPEMPQRYDEVSCACGLFLYPDAPSLRTNPCQQLWREAMLAQCMIDNGPDDDGLFVIAPAANCHVQNGVYLLEISLHKDLARNPPPIPTTDAAPPQRPSGRGLGGEIPTPPVMHHCVALQ